MKKPKIKPIINGKETDDLLKSPQLEVKKQKWKSPQTEVKKQEIKIYNSGKDTDNIIEKPSDRGEKTEDNMEKPSDRGEETKIDMEKSSNRGEETRNKNIQNPTMERFN